MEIPGDEIELDQKLTSTSKGVCGDSAGDPSDGGVVVNNQNSVCHEKGSPRFGVSDSSLLIDRFPERLP